MPNKVLNLGNKYTRFVGTGSKGIISAIMSTSIARKVFDIVVKTLIALIGKGLAKAASKLGLKAVLSLNGLEQWFDTTMPGRLIDNCITFAENKGLSFVDNL